MPFPIFQIFQMENGNVVSQYLLQQTPTSLQSTAMPCFSLLNTQIASVRACEGGDGGDDPPKGQIL